MSMGNVRLRVRRLGIAVVASTLGAVVLSPVGHGAVESCTYNPSTKAVTATVASAVLGDPQGRRRRAPLRVRAHGVR